MVVLSAACTWKLAARIIDRVTKDAVWHWKTLSILDGSLRVFRSFTLHNDFICEIVINRIQFGVICGMNVLKSTSFWAAVRVMSAVVNWQLSLRLCAWGEVSNGFVNRFLWLNTRWCCESTRGKRRCCPLTEKPIFTNANTPSSIKLEIYCPLAEFIPFKEITPHYKRFLSY